MSIFYNKVKKANPQNRAESKWYPSICKVGMVKSKEVAKQMADETTINPKEAEIAMYEMAKITKRLLLSGYTVQIDDLGSFYVTSNTIGVDSEEEVTAANVKNLNVRFRPCAEFKEAIEKAELRAKK